MKVNINTTLDVDEKAWAEEYGFDVSEVRQDVRSYVETLIHESYAAQSKLIREANVHGSVS